MEPNKLLRADYLDILFSGRNKAYGGYELRRKYGQRARKACLGVIAGAVIAAGIPVIASSFSGEETLRPPLETTTPIRPFEYPKPPKEIPLPAVAPPKQEKAATIKNPELKIERDELIREKPAAVEEIRNKQVALSTDDSGSKMDLSPAAASGGGGMRKAVEMNGPDNGMPATIVDQMPQFEGSLEKYLHDNLRYPEEARLAGTEGRVGVQFVVNEDGSISQAEVFHKAAPLLDAEALRVIRTMPRWRPGRQSGKPVKVYFSLPVTFTLD
jgi:protein TonB